MKFYLNTDNANASLDFRTQEVKSYTRQLESSWVNRSDITTKYTIPNDLSNLTPSQILFLYVLYFGNTGRIPSQIANIDWAKVEALESEQKAQKAQEAELDTTQSQTIDKTASLNEKIPAREASIESLQEQIKEVQDKIKNLESIKKPSETEQAELESTKQNLAEIESKLQTAQKSLENLKAQLKILASLYDITTGQGLCVDLTNHYPTKNLLQEQTQNLAYEIPLRQKELESLQKQLENEKDEDKKATLSEAINNASIIIADKKAELESNTQELNELKPKVETLLQDYAQAKKDLEFLEKNPLKILETPEQESEPKP